MSATTRPSRRTRRLVGAAAVVLVSLVASAGAASAAEPIVAEGAALAPSATCAWGDVELTYTATAAKDASLSFTAEDGSVLDAFSGPAYQADFSGTEHVLSQADAPAPTGTILAVYVWIGVAPPSATSAAEFFVLYRCDDVGNEQGGHNEVLQTCVGDYGSCPQTAAEALAEPTTTTTAPPSSEPPTSTAPASTPATPVAAQPTFTG